MPISSGVLWMVYADTAFLRKLERHNLCPLATIPRHRCGQRVYNCGQKTCIAPPRCPKLPSTPDACYRELRRILLPRTPVNKDKKRGQGYYTLAHFCLSVAALAYC